MKLQHFILTRFNLLLWHQDKEGGKVRTTKWLRHRCELFEHYCLPSVKCQTCQDFEWIVLIDSNTPEQFMARIADYQKDCPQMIPVFVEPHNGRFFAEIFKREIVKRLKFNDNLNDNSQRWGRVLTTYLDNDDALNVRFAEDLQHRVATIDDGTFVYYSDGYQYYTDYHYLMQIHYPRNHFVSVVEHGDPSTVKGIFGYGGHYHIEEIEGVKIERVENLPMWCEVVHEKNMINDAYFLRAKMVRDNNKLRHDFALDESVNYGMGIFIFRFLPRYMKTFVRRARHYLFGKKW